jgi:hypothetical protein
MTTKNVLTRRDTPGLLDRQPAAATDRDERQRELNAAVLYALKSGCFFPVPEPKPPYRVPNLIQWGAMRHLHTAIANFYRAEGRKP